MAYETVVLDVDDAVITVGTRVITQDDMPPGIVTKITDPDGDEVDGRSVTIYPRVYVRWDGDSEDDWFSTYWTGRYMDEDAPFQCDDLKVYTKVEETK